jgi:signal transduction histidine kinase
LSSRATALTDVEGALDRALLDLLAALRDETGSPHDRDSLAAMLAHHALIDSVRGCALCLIDGDQALRVAGVAGDTGTVTAGSVWQLAHSPVAQALARIEVAFPVEGGLSNLARALGVTASDQLLGAPLRIGERGEGEPTSLGALLLIRDRPDPLSDEECAFLENYTSLVALALVGAAPAQDWPGRARCLHRTVNAAVDLMGSLDAEEIVPRVLERTCRSLDASRAALLRLEGAELVMEGVHDVDDRPAPLDWRGPVSEQPLFVRAMRSGEVVVGDSAACERLPEGARAAFGDVSHILILPLRLHENGTGFMAVFRRQPRPFIHDDSIILQLLGHVALVALRNSRLYSDAQAASQTMSSFLNLIVHDLRAPLTVLSGYIDLLRGGTFGDGPEGWRKPMELIAGKLHETHRLVDDILLAARLESGAIPATIELLDLNEVISRAALRSEARAGLAGARIETVPYCQPVPVSGDGFHVDRIVDNLINNAISYGGPSPWIRLSVDRSEPPAICVEDHGVGIMPELQSRIFDRFFRIDHQIPGTGFGLHVGRVLAEACGGSLHIERSVPGVGSVFRLELPAAPLPG